MIMIQKLIRHSLTGSESQSPVASRSSSSFSNSSNFRQERNSNIYFCDNKKVSDPPSGKARGESDAKLANFGQPYVR